MRRSTHHPMRITLAASLIALSSLSCVVNYGNNNPNPPSTGHFAASLQFFPFQDTHNWWCYSLNDGSPLSISVVDTISDQDTMYYKVSYKEAVKDTDDDWFKTSNRGIQVSSSLRGAFSVFLPDTFADSTGTFTSGTSTVTYAYRDTVVVRGKVFSESMVLDYAPPFYHGFDRIILAKSIGIVGLVDLGGRIADTYVLDSARVADSTQIY